MNTYFRNTFSSFVVSIIYLSSFVHISIGFECMHGEHNLTALSGTWMSWTDDTVNENISYNMGLCSALVPSKSGDHACHPGTSICMIYSNGTTHSAGNFNASAVNLAGDENKQRGELSIVMTGDMCSADPLYNLTALINFKCGPTIGSPVFLDFQACVSYFNWETNLLCKNRKTVKEVPCYMYDEVGTRYDLSPLAKKMGAYLVSSEVATDVYINVCRDITPDTLTQHCPRGSAACRRSGGSYISLGEPTEGLKRGTDGRLTLKYVSTTHEEKAGCTSPASTTIAFICPKRGASKDPLTVSDFDCQYYIEWETEYACPETKLYNSTCVLTKQDAGIDIDLRPLTKNPGNPYKVSWVDPVPSKDSTYDFFLNVCADVGIGCPDSDHMDKVPACQTEQNNGDFGVRMGSTDHTQLSYVDGKLILTYKGGDVCHHNNFQRQTVINFVCNQTAGNGSPVFTHEDDCVYMFTWPTKYACLDHPVDEECRVNVDGKRYDLGPLVRTSGVDWMALHEQNDLYGRGDYLINVCHNVLQAELNSRCDPEAAICYRDGLTTKNLGRYENSPTFDKRTNNTVIKYTNGNICRGTQTITSTITFMCKPGEVETAPVLIQVSDDKCLYEFEWHTAAGCELGHYTGTDCKIYGGGLSFDLSLLKLPAGQSYQVDSPTDPEHDYFLNVCGPVTNKSCDTLETKNVGICQQPVSGSGNSYAAGQWTSELHYYDGMINLTYVDGTPYGDTKQTPRKSEIAFICDPDAGKGKAVLIAEVASDHYYSFEWRTAYACPQAILECTAFDDKLHKEYDLSSLTMLVGGNWVVAGSGNSDTKYYINVCQPLNKVNVGTGCDPLAAICRVKFDHGQELIDIPDMGHMNSKLQIVGDGALKLTYKGGKCNNGTATVPYLTNIQFLCLTTDLSSVPSAPLQDGPCEYTILWNTPAACPLQKDVDGENCTAKDVHTDYVFNLQPLKRPDNNPYTIVVNGTQYKLNVCGKIAADVCPLLSNGKPSAACQVNGSNKVSLAEPGYNLDFSEVGVMSLVYDGGRLSSGQRVSVKIIFICAPEQDIGSPIFAGKTGNTYIFKFRTALACTPKSMDCLVQDEAGKQYDLNPLIKEGSWTAVNPLNDQTTYHINVCSPVSGVPNCLAAPIGGCQVTSNGHFYNMGYVQSKPLAHIDGTLSIRYRNGDVCHKGTANEAHRSTRINFFCADTEHSPVYETETSTCEYVFNWRTPAACPLQSITGSECKVVDPRYKYEFDLNVLQRKGSDYQVVSGDYKYLINICAPLHETCGSNAAVGACQTKPLETGYAPVDAGHGNSNLMYVGGQLMLNYTDGAGNCHGQYVRQTIIQFSCDLSKDGSAGPRFIEESQNCHYLFDWPTNHACPYHVSATCSIKDSIGNSYDLSVLELLNDNYEVTDTVEKKRYILNVCRSVIHKPNATCPYTAAACMVDLTKPESATDKYKSIGQPNGFQMNYENGQIVIVYNNGDLCENGKVNMTTHITFTCDRDAKHSSPVGHFMVGECDHHFMWSSAAACAPDSGGGDISVDTDKITCKVTNPATGTVFDLSGLKVTKGTPWSVLDANGHKYEFNVCGAVKNSACDGASDSMGVCQSPDPKYNAGNAYHDLWFDDGVIIQNLTGGDPCHNAHYQRSTIISFVCNGHRGLGRPVFVDETEECTYYIAWHTNLVCEMEEIRCSVDTNNFQTIDLSPLSQDPDVIVHSTDDGSEFYLSVCSALTPTTSILCPPGSGVCLVKHGDGVLQTSLGKPKSSPTYDSKTGDVTLIYVNGSKCDTDASKNFTSRVIFSCLPGPIRSSPVFVSKVDCEYVFHWETHTVCVETTEVLCGYHDSNTGDFYDLSKLQHGTPIEVKDNDDTYLINMCAPITSDDTSSCNSHMVCRKQDGISFGEPSNFKAVKEGTYLKLTYELGGKCPGNKTAQSSIQFVCDRSLDTDGVRSVLASMDCAIVFEWKTSLVCPTIEKPCSVVVDDRLYDLSVLSQEHGAWNLTDADKNTYWINVCTAIGGASVPAACGKKSAACRKSKTINGEVDSLGSITAQKKLYKNSTTGALVLEYGEGGVPCSHKRSDNYPASTKINFICGTTFGAPVFVVSDKNKEQCIFEFNWKTKLACKVESETLSGKQGEFKETSTGLVVDLKRIWNQSFSISQKLDSGNENVYRILLNGSSAQCVDGVICQIKNKQTYRTLGTYSSAKYYMDDWIVEARYTTKEKCTGDQSSNNVSSIIQFTCSKSEYHPKLLYNYKDCFYMFSWDTTHACLIAANIVPSVTVAPDQGSGPGSSGRTSKPGVSASTIVGILATFLGAIILCILLVVFHKQDRRDACFVRMRGLFSRGRPEYSQLPTGTMDDMFGDEDEVVTVQNASGDDSRDEEPVISVRSTEPISYHDDSDEDLLA